MTQIASTNTFSYDLLVRCSALQDSLTAVQWAVPRFWEPIGNRPFPGFFNHIARVTMDHTVGLPLRKRVYTVEMRLIVGPLSAGYAGENEDAANQIQDMVFDLFDSRRRLEYGSGTAEQPAALRYVETALMQPIEGGIQPLDYTDSQSGPPLFYLGIQYFLDVIANHNVGRIVA